jgi:hypothetical protein
MTNRCPVAGLAAPRFDGAIRSGMRAADEILASDHARTTPAAVAAS